MLEGLEAVELKLSFVRSESFDLRIESEYFKKEFRLIKDKLFSIPHETLLYFLAQPVQTGHTPSMQNNNFYGGNIKFIKTDNLRDNYIKPFFNHYLSEEGNNEIKRTALKKQDIITTIIGATYDVIARSCIINQDVLPANINQNIALIRVDPYKIRPEFLTLYLNSKYGKKYLHYLSRQMEQVNLNCREVEQIIVPMLSNSFQLSLELHFNNGHKNLEESKKSYANAESLLVQSIGFQDFKPSTEAVNIKSFKESFWVSGRLDAEYYQKKYEDYISLVQKYPNGWQPLKTACNVKESNFNPDEKTVYKYIELSDIGKTGDITGCTTAFGNELPSRARRVVNTGDVVISSIEGSLGSCAMVQEEYNNALCSTGFYVINSNKMNSATLLVLFKSEVLQNILKQGCSGTILTAINKNEFLNIPLPLITDDVQEKISSSLQESFRLKKQSEQLLEAAKKAVEMAIEEGEEKAMELINLQIKN